MSYGLEDIPLLSFFFMMHLIDFFFFIDFEGEISFFYFYNIRYYVIIVIHTMLFYLMIVVELKLNLSRVEESSSDVEHLFIRPSQKSFHSGVFLPSNGDLLCLTGLDIVSPLDCGTIIVFPIHIIVFS